MSKVVQTAPSHAPAEGQRSFLALAKDTCPLLVTTLDFPTNLVSCSRASSYPCNRRMLKNGATALLRSLVGKDS